MAPKNPIVVEGFPESSSVDIQSHIAVCESRLIHAVEALLTSSGLEDICVVVGTQRALAEARTLHREKVTPGEREQSPAERANRYVSQSPLYTFDQLIASDSLRELLLDAADTFKFESLIFDTWGLRKIQPFPKRALNFYGDPGTGKTLAAHAIASYLRKKIIVASYADIESKYVGDGPKNVKAVFLAAQQYDAVLFIDEADSLLSSRLTNVQQGAEQAINSMRSQLLLCLQEFRGIVIFATNLIQNYDRAFESRIESIEFPMPDEAARQAIWRQLLVPELPLTGV